MTADLPTAGRIEAREHLLPIRVYYEDTDFTGVVYHGAHVRFLERGRSDFLRLAGVHHAELAAGGFAFAVASLAVDFKRPGRIDDALVVKSRFLELRGPRLVIGQQILRGEELLVDAKVDAACIGLDGKPRRPPTAMIEALRRLIF